MWDAIKKALGGGAANDPKDIDPTVAAAALLVEAALADGIYADLEQDRILALLKSVFALDDKAARRALSAGEAEAEQAVDHHRFTKIVKTLPLEQREALIEGLWSVVFADGEESPFEDAFVRKIADLLGVDDRTSRLARRRALD